MTFSKDNRPPSLKLWLLPQRPVMKNINNKETIDISPNQNKQEPSTNQTVPYTSSDGVYQGEETIRVGQREIKNPDGSLKGYVTVRSVISRAKSPEGFKCTKKDNIAEYTYLTGSKSSKVNIQTLSERVKSPINDEVTNSVTCKVTRPTTSTKATSVSPTRITDVISQNPTKSKITNVFVSKCDLSKNKPKQQDCPDAPNAPQLSQVILDPTPQPESRFKANADPRHTFVIENGHLTKSPTNQKCNSIMLSDKSTDVSGIYTPIQSPSYTDSINETHPVESYSGQPYSSIIDNTPTQSRRSRSISSSVILKPVNVPNGQTALLRKTNAIDLEAYYRLFGLGNDFWYNSQPTSLPQRNVLTQDYSRQNSQRFSENQSLSFPTSVSPTNGRQSNLYLPSQSINRSQSLSAVPYVNPQNYTIQNTPQHTPDCFRNYQNLERQSCPAVYNPLSPNALTQDYRIQNSQRFSENQALSFPSAAYSITVSPSNGRQSNLSLPSQSINRSQSLSAVPYFTPQNYTIPNAPQHTPDCPRNYQNLERQSCPAVYNPISPNALTQDYRIQNSHRFSENQALSFPSAGYSITVSPSNGQQSNLCLPNQSINRSQSLFAVPYFTPQNYTIPNASQYTPDFPRNYQNLERQSCPAVYNTISPNALTQDYRIQNSQQFSENQALSFPSAAYSITVSPTNGRPSNLCSPSQSINRSQSLSAVPYTTPQNYTIPNSPKHSPDCPQSHQNLERQGSPAAYITQLMSPNAKPSTLSIITNPTTVYSDPCQNNDAVNVSPNPTFSTSPIRNVDLQLSPILKNNKPNGTESASRLTNVAMASLREKNMQGISENPKQKDPCVSINANIQPFPPFKPINERVKSPPSKRNNDSKPSSSNLTCKEYCKMTNFNPEKDVCGGLTQNLFCNYTGNLTEMCSPCPNPPCKVYPGSGCPTSPEQKPTTSPMQRPTTSPEQKPTSSSKQRSYRNNSNNGGNNINKPIPRIEIPDTPEVPNLTVKESVLPQVNSQQVAASGNFLSLNVDPRLYTAAAHIPPQRKVNFYNA